MLCDWYAATIESPPRDVLEALAASLRGEVRHCRGMHGYERGATIEAAAGVAARVFYGGVNPNPHAFASGEYAEPFRAVVRSCWPRSHAVSRFDSAEDFEGPGAWDELSGLCLGLADSRRLKVHHTGDFHREQDGRTLYLGSRKSAVFVRLYEKGKQLRAQVTHGQAAISPDWCRLEAVVRPHGEARKLAALAEPAEMWGYGSWTAELVRRAANVDVPRVAMQVYREADDERAFAFLCRQYGPLLSRLQSDLGDWACVGKQIGETIARQRRERS
jgi:hypothetical protein